MLAAPSPSRCATRRSPMGASLLSTGSDDAVAARAPAAHLRAWTIAPTATPGRGSRDALWRTHQWLDRAPKGRNHTGAVVPPARPVRRRAPQAKARCRAVKSDGSSDGANGASHGPAVEVAWIPRALPRRPALLRVRASWRHPRSALPGAPMADSVAQAQRLANTCRHAHLSRWKPPAAPLGKALNLQGETLYR